jgi:hypothetical protein
MDSFTADEMYAVFAPVASYMSIIAQCALALTCKAARAAVRAHRASVAAAAYDLSDEDLEAPYSRKLCKEDMKLLMNVSGIEGDHRSELERCANLPFFVSLPRWCIVAFMRHVRMAPLAHPALPRFNALPLIVPNSMFIESCMLIKEATLWSVYGDDAWTNLAHRHMREVRRCMMYREDWVGVMALLRKVHEYAHPFILSCISGERETTAHARNRTPLPFNDDIYDRLRVVITECIIDHLREAHSYDISPILPLLANATAAQTVIIYAIAIDESDAPTARHCHNVLHAKGAMRATAGDVRDLQETICARGLRYAGRPEDSVLPSLLLQEALLLMRVVSEHRRI